MSDRSEAGSHRQTRLQRLSQGPLRLIRRLLSKEQRRFVKFCLVGASGVPVNLLCTWAGYELFFASLGGESRKAAAYLFGIVVSIFTNFLLNDLWTWKDREKRHGRFVGRLLRFYLVCSLASGMQFGTAMALSVWAHLHYLLAQLVGIVLAMAVNFLVNNAWTFRSRGHSPAPPDLVTAASPGAESSDSRQQAAK